MKFKKKSKKLLKILLYNNCFLQKFSVAKNLKKIFFKSKNYQKYKKFFVINSFLL